MRRFLPAIHTFALGLWFGSLIMTAAAAAVLFPTLKALSPTLGAYPKYTGDHWLLAAGRVADILFFFSDIISFACATVAFGTLLVAFVREHVPRRALLTAARLCLMCVAISILSYKLMVLQPRMNANLRAYWQFAEAGDQTRADTFQAAFTADHPTASTLLGVLALIVGVLLFMGGLPSNPTQPIRPGDPNRPSPFEEPKLRS